MQYIDKDSNRGDGDKITKAYLRKIFINEEGYQRYPVDYNDSFRKLPKGKEDTYYKQMTQVLLDNQSHYCCYCMRRLTGDGDTTLEHIIPQSVDVDSVGYYQRDVFPMLGDQHIELSDLFSKEINPDLSRLPHTVCYDNLVASCHGTFPVVKRGQCEEKAGHSCNHPRGDKPILPLFFLNNIDTIVLYKTNGEVYANEESDWFDAANELVCNAKLNWGTLKDIRCLWYVLRDKELSDIIDEGNERESRLNLIQDNLWLTKISTERIEEIKNKFTKDQYWECFLLYYWFHSYNWDVA